MNPRTCISAIFFVHWLCKIEIENSKAPTCCLVSIQPFVKRMFLGGKAEHIEASLRVAPCAKQWLFQPREPDGGPALCVTDYVMSVIGVIFQFAVTGRPLPVRPQLPPPWPKTLPTVNPHHHHHPPRHEHSDTLLRASAAVLHACHWFVSAVARLLCHNITPVNVAAEGASDWSALVTSSLPCLFGGRGVMRVSSRRDAERRERKGERLVPCHVRHAGTESDQGSTPRGGAPQGVGKFVSRLLFFFTKISTRWFQRGGYNYTRLASISLGPVLSQLIRKSHGSNWPRLAP